MIYFYNEITDNPNTYDNIETFLHQCFVQLGKKNNSTMTICTNNSDPIIGNVCSQKEMKMAAKYIRSLAQSGSIFAIGFEI